MITREPIRRSHHSRFSDVTFDSPQPCEKTTTGPSARRPAISHTSHSPPRPPPDPPLNANRHDSNSARPCVACFGSSGAFFASAHVAPRRGGFRSTIAVCTTPSPHASASPVPNVMPSPIKSKARNLQSNTPAPPLLP